MRGKFEAIPGLIVRIRVAEWESEPLEPIAVMVKVPVAAFELAPKIRDVLAPTAREKGLAGLEATPLGSPLRAT